VQALMPLMMSFVKVNFFCTKLVKFINKKTVLKISLVDNKELIQMRLARLNDFLKQYENKGEQMNFKGSLSDDDTENEQNNYEQNEMPDDESSVEYNLPAKKSAAFLRFGKSPAYLRFGRGQAYLRFGKRGQAYLRFGKSNPAYLRFGR
jgi:hypothetical protein